MARHQRAFRHHRNQHSGVDRPARQEAFWPYAQTQSRRCISGGGSIPFEAARIGCEAYGSDLNPVAALLTWASIHLIGGGKEGQEQVQAAQQAAYAAADQQITKWGIEHNSKGWRADAYLYCVNLCRA